MDDRERNDSTAEAGADAPVVPVDEHGCLRDPVACQGCGYLLRGLDLDGHCPECRTPVARSVRGDLLRYSHPDWLRRVARGLTLLTVAILSAVAVGVLSIPFMILLNFAPVRDPDTLFYTVLLPIDLALTAMQVIAFWLITTPEPARASNEPTARRVARVALVSAAVLGIAGDPAAVGLQGWLDAVLTGVLVLGGVASAVGLVALSMTLRALALRLPDERLAHRTRLVMWWLLSSVGVLVAGGVLVAFGGPAVAFVGLLLLPVLITVLIFGIWSIVLLLQYRVQINHAAALAVRS